jgi:simple sugar transport system permease protein
MKLNLRKFLIDNIVTILFITISILGLWVSKQPMMFIVNELVQRISRNSFLVFSLIIPILAGLGLNFSIVVGAMAGQMAIIMVADWGVRGFWGVMLAFLLALPLSWLFGWLTGKLLNKTRGQEMIASMIVGFFANGIYQFIYLFLVGTIIPMRTPEFLLRSGIGVRNTIDLENNIKYALDSIVKMPLYVFGILIAVIFITTFVLRYLKNKENPVFDKKKNLVNIVIYSILLIIFALAQFTDIMPAGIRILKGIKVPFITVVFVALAGIFNIVITKTKLGQDFRTVGQSQHIASVSGINVDKIRIIAVTISTVLAAWGQIILMQNIGVLNTFGSHQQIGLFSVAALLVGGASVNKATIGQALLGVTLFHTLFIVSPYAGKELFGDAQIGEFFRAFVAYGVIGLSLGLYAWKKGK